MIYYVPNLGTFPLSSEEQVELQSHVLYPTPLEVDFKQQMLIQFLSF